MSAEDGTKPNPGEGNGEEEERDTNDKTKITETTTTIAPGERPMNTGTTRTDDYADCGATLPGTHTGTNSTTIEEEVPMTFAQRLMEMLSNESNASIITWLPHGKGWIIQDKKRLAAELLPKHFSRQSKFASFTRKLNRWNFTRVTRGPELGAYYHPLFQRDRPELVLSMSCIDSKSPQRLQPLNPIALGYGMALPDLIGDPHTLPYLHTFAQYQQHQFDAVASSSTSLPPTIAVGQSEGDADTNNIPSAGAVASQPDGASAAASDPNLGAAGTALLLDAPTVAAEDPARAAYLAYQAEYYARMLAQQQQQQATAGGSLPSLALLASDQLPLPLPPTSKKFAVRETLPRPQQQGDSSVEPQQARAPTVPGANERALEL